MALNACLIPQNGLHVHVKMPLLFLMEPHFDLQHIVVEKRADLEKCFGLAPQQYPSAPPQYDIQLPRLTSVVIEVLNHPINGEVSAAIASFAAYLASLTDGD